MYFPNIKRYTTNITVESLTFTPTGRGQCSWHTTFDAPPRLPSSKCTFGGPDLNLSDNPHVPYSLPIQLCCLSEALYNYQNPRHVPSRFSALNLSNQIVNMSGFEVVGVVLGALPVVTMAIKMAKGRTTPCAYSWSIKLSTETIIFHGFLRNLLASDVPDGNIRKLLGQGPSPDLEAWKDPLLASTLLKKLGKERADNMVGILQQIRDLLKVLAAEIAKISSGLVRLPSSTSTSPNSAVADALYMPHVGDDGEAARQHQKRQNWSLSSTYR